MQTFPNPQSHQINAKCLMRVCYAVWYTFNGSDKTVRCNIFIFHSCGKQWQQIPSIWRFLCVEIDCLLGKLLASCFRVRDRYWCLRLSGLCGIFFLFFWQGAFVLPWGHRNEPFCYLDSSVLSDRAAFWMLSSVATRKVDWYPWATEDFSIKSGINLPPHATSIRHLKVKRQT